MMPEDFFDEMIASGVPEGARDKMALPDEVIGEIGPTFDLSIFVEPRGILCQFQCGGRSQQWTVPKTVVRRVHKAMSIDHVFDLLGAGRLSATNCARR